MSVLAARPAPPDWAGISRLMVDNETPGRALLADDPAIALGTRTGPPVLLIEPAEPVMVTEPGSGRTYDLHVELLVQRGFQRFRLDAGAPPLPGWTVRATPGRLELRDEAGNAWARPAVAPGPQWTIRAGRHYHVLVLYGAWLGVRTPRGVNVAQFGPAQRAAELRAGRMHGHVAAATVRWAG